MENLRDNLNYNFNTMLSRLQNLSLGNLNKSERHSIVSWVNKLKSETNSLEEAQLRNDLLYYLLKSVQTGCLKPPFDQKPPKGRVINVMGLLPPEMKTEGKNVIPKIVPRPQIFELSPDKGAFLAAQPVPRSGAFCYLAIVNKTPNCK